MDIFWFYVIAIIGIAVILIGVPYTCIRAVGTNKTFVRIVNGVLGGILTLQLIVMCIGGLIRLGYGTGYDRYSGGFFGFLKYIETVDGYHILKKNDGFSSVDIAVPEESCDIPVISGIYPNVTVYTEQLRPLFVRKKENMVELDGYKCYISEAPIAVFPDFGDIIFIVLMFDIPLMFIFNFIEIFYVRAQRRELMMIEGERKEVQD